MKELVALAKAKPGTINYASGGNGVTNHLVMEMFRGAAGIDMTHVPYKGGPPALTDLIGGQVNVMFETSVARLPFVKQGKLRALAVSSAKRIERCARYADGGRARLSGFSGVPWVAIVAPANTPAPIVAKLNAEVNKALASKDDARALRGAGRRADADDARTSSARSSRPRSPSGPRPSRTPARRSNDGNARPAPADAIARTLSGFVHGLRLDAGARRR